MTDNQEPSSIIINFSVFLKWTKVSMKTEAALEPIGFKRTPKTIDVSTSDLENYVGDYNLMVPP